jgi:acyl-CoA thioesterase I
MKYFILLLAATLFAFALPKKHIKVACVGDSITEGDGVAVQSKSSYPVVLDSILGKGYSVLNCGRSGATMLKKSDLPYWICTEFHNVFAFQPDIIVIKLGTNDSKTYNWNADAYRRDYQSMIDSFQTIATKPKIFIALPVPAFETKWGINDSTITKGVIPILRDLAQKNKLPVIDLYQALSNHAAYFPDKIHPNEAGARAIAVAVAEAIR